jgi:hypothetical protein
VILSIDLDDVLSAPQSQMRFCLCIAVNKIAVWPSFVLARCYRRFAIDKDVNLPNTDPVIEWFADD